MRTNHVVEDFFNVESFDKTSSESPPEKAFYNTHEVRSKVRNMFLSLTKHASEQFQVTLPFIELITENTHTEQIWQQIELQILSVLNLIKPNLELSDSIVQNFGRTDSKDCNRNIAASTHGEEFLPSTEVPHIKDNEQLVPAKNLAVEKALVKKQLHIQKAPTHEKNTVNNMKESPIPKSSSFQLMQEKLSKEIDKLESRAITKESWSFVGEATGRQRPLNSALESDIEFSQVSQPRPNISIEATRTLENLINQRILLNNWDDVKATDTIQLSVKNEYIQLNDAKEKVGLGEVYAKAYVHQRSNEDKEVLSTIDSKDGDLVRSVRKLFDSVIYKLTSLTDSSMNAEKRSDEILSEKRSLDNSSETNRTPEEIFKVMDNRKHKKLTSNLGVPLKKKSKSVKKFSVPKLQHLDGFRPERAQTVRISSESANIKQNYMYTKSDRSVYDKSSKVFNSLEMLKTSVSQKQKVPDSHRNVNEKKL